MYLAIKAALLSGLLFPGAGQIYLKRTLRGIGYIIATLIPMIIVVADLTRIATRALDNLAVPGSVIDMTTISDAAARATAHASGLRIDLMLMVMVGCWLVSVVDAFRLGKHRDRQPEIPDHGQPAKPLGR